MFINETIIEQEAANLEASPEKYQAAIAELTEEQPYIMGYLFSDSFKYLTEEEQGYLLYLTLVIWKSVSELDEDLAVASEELIGQFEEQNWEAMEASSNKKFRERLDVFFQDTPQEDLLAFIEDSLESDKEDGEEFLTKPGREIIFVGLKTVVDVLTQKKRGA